MSVASRWMVLLWGKVSTGTIGKNVWALNVETWTWKKLQVIKSSVVKIISLYISCPKYSCVKVINQEHGTLHAHIMFGVILLCSEVMWLMRTTMKGEMQWVIFSSFHSVRVNPIHHIYILCTCVSSYFSAALDQILQQVENVNVFTDTARC